MQDIERSAEENIKIVEMDVGEYKAVTKRERSEHRSSTKHQQQVSAAASGITDKHLEEMGRAQSSPQCYSKGDEAVSYPRSEYAESLYSEYPFYPNYMANTQSSRAKVRSHSAPKQRPVETFERQPSATRRRPSIEGRNLPRAVRMQRSSSHVGSAPHNFHYPWSVKLDRSAVSLKDSECGSTDTNYCRSLVGFEVSFSHFTTSLSSYI